MSEISRLYVELQEAHETVNALRQQLMNVTRVADDRLAALVAAQEETKRVQYLERLAEYAEHSRSCPAFERASMSDRCTCGLDEVRAER
jgi:hypothetical protein